MRHIAARRASVHDGSGEFEADWRRALSLTRTKDPGNSSTVVVMVVFEVVCHPKLRNVTRSSSRKKLQPDT